jgi:hypothetical protein
MGVHDAPEESPILATPQSRAIQPTPTLQRVERMTEGCKERRESHGTPWRGGEADKALVAALSGLSPEERPKLVAVLYGQ